MSIPILGQGGTPADAGGEYVQIKDEGPKIRLLYCYNCDTIEELPDFKGNPDDDHLLQIMIEKHESAGIPHNGFLSDIGVKLWSQEKVRKEIIKNLRTRVGGGLADIDPDYYLTKAIFYDDAMKCFSEHLRPKGRCPDWKAANKKLIPKTAADRKELGLSLTPTTHTFLCDFCPAKTFMVTKAREQSGLYE